ncbi:MAG: hypothetical protein IJF83_11020 [Methanobrevibacter sp.]|nr:hypothetical protein [Methanobrevibacter sp.]
MTSAGISNGSTNSNGELELQGDALTQGENTFIVKNGINDENGIILSAVSITPTVLNNVKVIVNGKTFKGSNLPITARISADVSDLSNYTIHLSGAVEGDYVTDSYGQVTVYYTGNGEGSKTVVATAGNWSATATFEDYIEYWNTTENIEENYNLNQGFAKLAQYYSIDTSTKGMGYVCIGEYAELDSWELSFKVINSLSNVFFDICGWQGEPATIYDMNLSRKVSFSANDIVKATFSNGVLTVLKNNNSFFTKSLATNTLPTILIKDGASSVNVGGNAQTVLQSVALNFNDLTLKRV